MMDLFVLVADADMQAVFRAVLARPEALGIRPVKFKVERHPNRDAGVFRTGPELLRAIPKAHYRYFVIALDHDGSGCNKRPEECAIVLQNRLDSFTFADRSMVVVVAPELEEWLWHDPSAIGEAAWADATLGPKERLRQVFTANHQRRPRPLDFEQIATRASLYAWTSSPSFRILKETLQNWFPGR